METMIEQTRAATAGMQDQDKLLTLKQAAEVLGIATQTARNWLLENRFPVRTHKLGSRRMVRRSDLVHYIASL